MKRLNKYKIFKVNSNTSLSWGDWHPSLDKRIKYIPIKDFKKSEKRNKGEKMIPYLLNWKEKQALKAKGWSKGFGSDMTAWDSKNPLAWRQDQENKIYESPDHLKTLKDVRLNWHQEDAYAFGYYKGKMLISRSGGETHFELITIEFNTYIERFNKMTLSQKIDFILNNTYLSEDKIKEICKEETEFKDLPKNIQKSIRYSLYNNEKEMYTRERMKYSGRLWKESKYITFWDFPKDYDELWKVLNDIMEEFKREGKELKITDDWYIEVVTDKFGNQIENDYLFWGESEIKGPIEGYVETSKIIKIKDYMGSKKFSEEERAIHLLSWAEKQELKKRGWGKDWGSNLTSWDSKNPLWWRQAKYQENAQYYNKELNPKFWSNDIFNERIRQKLVTIATEFYSSLGYKAPIQDIILTGSLSNYNWNEHSDLDVHVVVDFSKINTNVELVKKLVDGERTLWNLKHNIRIKGHDVELYIQDINELHIATGQYSLLNNKWILKPKWNQPQINEEEINFKYLTYKSGIDRLEEISNMKMTPEIAHKNYLFASEYKKRIHSKRKEGLSKNGEFSLENLVFKKLRNNGDFERLINIITRFYDKIYSQ